MIRNISRVAILVAVAVMLPASVAFSEEVDRLIQTFDTDGWDDLTVPQEARERLVGMGPKAVPALMKALAHKNDRVRTWCEAALMQIAQEGPNFEEVVSDLLLEDLRKTMHDSEASLTQRQIAVRLLARLGGQQSVEMLADSIDDEAVGDYVVFFLAETGPQAVPHLQKALESDSVKARMEAAKALGRTGDESAVAPLWSAFTGAEPELKVILLQSIISIGGDEALTTLKKALKDDDVSARSQAASGVGQLGGLAEIAILEQMLEDDETVRIAAAGGLIMLGDRRRETGDDENARRAYLSAYDAVFNPDQVAALAGRLREIGESVDVSEKFGSIYNWWVIGPFDNADGKGFDAVYPPEKEIILARSYESMRQQVGWKKHHTEDAVGMVDATELIQPDTNVALYALAFVESPEEMDVQIRAGSDDTLSIWLNGKRIHHNDVARGVTFDEDKVDAHLQKGVNSLMLKVCQGGGGWGFVARIVDRNGKPIPALRVLSEQP